MTLEDFFTLNELENGLTNPNRVNELITVMQSEKDSVVNSFGQTTPQWAKVATVITATENKECLDRYIQLNGHLSIDKWLKDAQRLKDDDENGLLEELIISLLRALEKLQIDEERLFSSGIMKTVQALVANNNHLVCEKAKELCDNWMQLQEKNNDKVESKPPDNSMDSETKKRGSLDHVDPSSKSTVDDDSKSEGIKNSDDNNANEIDFRDKTDLLEKSSLSNHSEQIASVVDMDNVADDGESPKTTSSSDRENDTLVGAESNGNSENGSSFSKLSINNKKSDLELDYGMIDPLDIARQVAIEVEREVDSREQKSQNQNEHVEEPLKDAETLVSQISEVAQESEPDTKKSFSGFDLNQEVCSEEADHLGNPVSSSISVVSSPRAAAAAQEFDGNLGPGTHSNSNKRLDFHDFDLNVAEGGQEVDMVSIAGLPSGEESSVANPGNPERLQWDLNSIRDDQTYPASSSSSSASSSKHPILRSIDLNLSNQPNSEDPVISIFGAKVEVKRNDHKSLDSSTHYGSHNGMFFPMPMYGSSPTSSSHGMPMPMVMQYMVDSRGTPFVPQIMGSQPPLPFFKNMAAAGAPTGASGLTPPPPPPPPPPQHTFGLNTGLMMNGGLRHFFPQNVNEQASSSSVLGKRHEPDSDWQFIPVNKHHQPPWR